jgi:hypothetical protein
MKVLKLRSLSNFSSSVAAWLSETVLRGRGPGASGSNPTEGGGFFRRKEPPPGHGCVCMSIRG